MATYQISPSNCFDFSTPSEWPKCRRFEIHRTASGLVTKSDEEQVNTLIHTMGETAEDIFNTFGLSEDDQKKYETVYKIFGDHFIARRNVMYERAKFNQRKQQQSEMVDTFITSLYKLAENCAYNALKEEMIRDRLLVGLQDTRLSKKLQLDANLTLAKAITMV